MIGTRLLSWTLVSAARTALQRIAFGCAVFGCLASTSENAAAADRPYLQRWGVAEVEPSFDYHEATHRMITRHGYRAVLWDLASGLAVRDFKSPGEPVAVGFSADGGSVLVAAAGGFVPGGGLRVFDVESGELKCELPAPPSTVHDAAISPDGRYVAAGCYHHTVSVWETQAGMLLWRKRVHRGHVNFVRFSPDGRRLITGGYGPLVVLWDVPSGEVVRRFSLPSELSWAAFSPDGERLVTLGSSSETARIVIWDVDAPQPLHVLRRGVRSAWFVGDRLALLEYGGEVTFIDPLRKQPARTEVPGGPQPKGRVVRSKHGWQLRIPKDGGPTILSGPDGTWQRLDVPRYGAVTHRPIDVTADGARLLTAFEGRRSQPDCQGVCLWDLNPPRPVRTFDAPLARFHPDGRRLLAGGGKRLTLYDALTFKPLRTYELEYGAFESAEFVDGGRQLLTGSGDWYDGDEGQILLWDVETGKVIRSLAPSEQAVYYAALDAERRRLLATFTHGEGGNVDFARVFDTAGGQLLQHIECAPYHRAEFRLAPDGKHVAAVTGGQTSIREPEHWQLLGCVPGRAASFNADGSLLATHVAGRSTHVWAADGGTHLRSLPTVRIQPTPALFHPGRAMLLIGGPRDLQFWDVRRDEPVARLATFGGCTSWLAIASGGHVAGSADALGRIAWRKGSGLRVAPDAQRVAQRLDPAAVGSVLTQSLPPDKSLADVLSADPEPLPEALRPRTDAASRPELRVRDAQRPECDELAGDAAGRQLLVSHRGAPAALWRLNPVGLAHRFPACPAKASVALTPDGKLAVVEGPSRGILGIWNTATGRFLRQLSIPLEDEESDPDALHLSVHPASRYLAAVYGDTADDTPEHTGPTFEEVVIWDLATGRIVRRIRDDSPRAMRTAAFAPDGNRLLIGYFVPKGRQSGVAWDAADVWDWRGGRKLSSMRSTGYDADHPKFSTDGRRVLLGEGWAVAVRSFPDGKLLARLRHEDGTIAGALTPDGKTMLAATLGDGALLKASVARPEERTFSPSLTPGRYHYARDLWIGGSGRLVFSPSRDGRVSVFRLSDMQPVAQLATRGAHQWLVTTAAGYYACSDAARPYLTWGYAGRPYPLERFAAWGKRPERVAEVLAGEDAVPLEIPAEAIPPTAASLPPEPAAPDPWAEERHAEQRAIDVMREAGAELEFDRVKALTMVKLEERDVGEDVFAALPALQDVDRLYLADTGMTDRWLRELGLMRRIKRLSLWGNPITDRGLAELCGLWRLEVLDVHDTAVTEQSLRTLRHIDTLKTLIVPKHVDAEKLKADMGRVDLNVIPRVRP